MNGLAQWSHLHASRIYGVNVMGRPVAELGKLPCHTDLECHSCFSPDIRMCPTELHCIAFAQSSIDIRLTPYGVGLGGYGADPIHTYQATKDAGMEIVAHHGTTCC